MLLWFYVPILVLLIQIYFKLAIKFNIIDHPNHRSSHSKGTIRGAGIIFPIALFLQFLIIDFQYPFFILGLMIISLVSFYDDFFPLSNKIRLVVHLVAVSLLFIQLGLLDWPLWIITLVYILVVGTINAYNFMDGINGITGAYSLITILCLFLINERYEAFINSEWLIVSILALMVFNFFNFRSKAKCFAGDVGSVGMAFIIIFFILQLILTTGDLKYITFLLLYGLDTVTTIVFRLIRRENIFVAHRTHFYQHLANVKKWPHLSVSALYLVAQLIVNIMIIYLEWNSGAFVILILLVGFLFVGLRFAVEGKRLLLERGLANQEI